MTIEQMTLAEAINEYGPEVLTELSTKTLDSYQNKAKGQIDATKKRGQPSKEVRALRSKREAGISKAGVKIANNSNKEYAKREIQAGKDRAELYSHFQEHAPKVLAEHGYSHHSSEGDRHVYTKTHSPSGHVSMVSIHKDPNKGSTGNTYVAKHRLVDTSGYTAHENHSHWGISRNGPEEIAKAKSDHLGSLKKTIARHEEHLHSGWMSESEVEDTKLLMTEGVNVLTEAVLEKNALVSEEIFNDIILEKIADLLEGSTETEPTITQLIEAYGDEALGVILESVTVGELVEEFGLEILDELSKDTLKSYVKKASENLYKNAHQQGHYLASGQYAKKWYSGLNNSAKRFAGISMAADKLAK